MGTEWRRYVDPLLREHLLAQINETRDQKKAIVKASNKANAQLWIAVANLSKQVFDLNLKLNYLERALQDIGRKKE